MKIFIRKYAIIAAAFSIVLIMSLGNSSAESPRLDSRFSDLKLRLGDSFDAVVEGTRLPGCIVIRKVENSCPNDICGSLQGIKIKSDLATGFQQLHEVLDYDVTFESSASAKFGVFSGKGKTKFSFAKSTDDFSAKDSVNYVLSVEKNFTSVFAKEYELKPEYKTLIDDGRFDEFRASCGTHFVAAQTRVGHATLMLSANFLDSKSKDVFKSHFMQEVSGSYGDVFGGSASLTANLKFSKEVINKSGNVNFKFIGRGGDDSELKLISSVGVVNNYAPLLVEFEKYSNSITEQKSAIGHHYLTSFRSIDSRLPSFYEDENQVNFLKQILYLRVQIDQSLRKIAVNKKELKNDDASKAFRQVLEKVGRELVIQNIYLADQARECLSNRTKCDAGTAPDEVDMTKVFFLGDLVRDVTARPSCQYVDGVLSVIRLGVNGVMPFQSNVYDVDVDWVSIEGGKTGVFPFDSNKHLTFGDNGKFAMTIDTIRTHGTGEKPTLANAQSVLKDASDRFYVLKMSSNLLPIPRSYILRSGVGSVNCPVTQ